MIAIGAQSWLRHSQRGARPPFAGQSVPCGDCTACCRHVRIPLVSKRDDFARYDTEEDHGETILRRHEDDSCIYLEENRCTIYADRPLVCRTFDCRALLVTQVPIPAHVFEAAQKKFQIAIKEPGDREFLVKIRSRVRLLEAMHPTMNPALLVQEALRP